jgi:hypothetical protein
MSSAGRAKEIGGGGKEGGSFSWGCAQANGYLLCLKEAKRVNLIRDGPPPPPSEGSRTHYLAGCEAHCGNQHAVPPPGNEAGRFVEHGFSPQQPAVRIRRLLAAM